MSMTRKHFKKAAEIVNSMARFGGNDGGFAPEKALAAQEAFVSLFSGASDSFDRARFVKACGVGEVILEECRQKASKNRAA